LSEEVLLVPSVRAVLEEVVFNYPTDLRNFRSFSLALRKKGFSLLASLVSLLESLGGNAFLPASKLLVWRVFSSKKPLLKV
jgi:hypothetical protein